MLRDAWDSSPAPPSSRNAESRAAEREAKRNAAAVDRVKSIQDWKRLTPAQKDLVLSSYGRDTQPFVRTGLRPVDDLPEALKPFGRSLLRLAKEQVSTDVDPGEFALVGQPQFEVEVVTLETGEILGGNVWIYQDGASIFDVPSKDREPYYPSWEKAAKVGAIDDDVNWRAFRLYDEARTPVAGDDALVWSGH